MLDGPFIKLEERTSDINTNLDYSLGSDFLLLNPCGSIVWLCVMVGAGWSIPTLGKRTNDIDAKFKVLLLGSSIKNTESPLSSGV